MCLCIQGQEHDWAAGAERRNRPAFNAGPGPLQGRRHTRPLQANLAHTDTRCSAALFPCFFFIPHTICILCMVTGVSPRRFIFTALILCFYFSCIWCQTMVKHAHIRIKRLQTGCFFFSPFRVFKKIYFFRRNSIVMLVIKCFNLMHHAFCVSIHMDMCVRASADILHVCVGVLYKKDWRQEQCNRGGICSGMGFSPEARCVSRLRDLNT